MRNTFKPTQNNQKQHLREVIWLTNHLLKQADDKVLLNEETKAKEFEVDGTIKIYPLGKFTLPTNKAYSHRLWKAKTKAVQIQSPGEGAYAFVIVTGRNISARVFCNRLENKNYQCEAIFFKAEENLGDVVFQGCPVLANEL